MEEIIDRKYKVTDTNNLFEITKFDEYGIKNKCKSDSDVEREFRVWDKDRLNDNEEDYASPSDSCVTIIRVRRRSKNIILAKRIWEGDIILGDGCHVTDSPSMINLASCEQNGASSIIKDERLVSLSSWVGNEIPVSTVSDSGICVPRSIKDTSSSFLSFAAWTKYCLVNKERKRNENAANRANRRERNDALTQPEVNERIFESMLPQRDSSKLSNNLRLIETPRTKKTSLKISTQMENVFRRFVRCSWISGCFRKNK